MREEIRDRLTANQKQFDRAKDTMQLAGDEVEKVGDMASMARDKVREVQQMLSPIEPALAQISASGQSATSTYTEAVGKLFALTGEAANINAISARNYGSILLDVLEGRADQNLPAELTQVTEHARTVIKGLAMVVEGLTDLHRAAVIAEDTIALVAGDRLHTGGWPGVAPGGLTPVIQNDINAYLEEL